MKSWPFYGINIICVGVHVLDVVCVAGVYQEESIQVPYLHEEEGKKQEYSDLFVRYLGVVFFGTIFVVKNYCVDWIGLSTLYWTIQYMEHIRRVVFVESDLLVASVNTEISKHRDGQIYQPIINLKCNQNLNRKLSSLLKCSYKEADGKRKSL